MLLRLAIFAAVVLGVGLVVTQMILPAIRRTGWFPLLRPDMEDAESELDRARSAKEEAELLLAAAKARAEARKLEAEIDRMEAVDSDSTDPERTDPK